MPSAKLTLKFLNSILCIGYRVEWTHERGYRVLSESNETATHAHNELAPLLKRLIHANLITGDGLSLIKVIQVTGRMK